MTGNLLRHRLRRVLSRGAPGFTLIELLVVLAILALLIGLVGPRVLAYLGESKVKAARLQIDGFASALDLYYLDMGAYPPANDGLGALLRQPADAANWNGPYLAKSAVPDDPWGRPYLYRVPGEHGAYDLLSLGADGQEGGTGNAADITNWQE